MRALLLRKKDYESPAFAAAEIKWSSKNVDCNIAKDAIFIVSVVEEVF